MTHRAAFHTSWAPTPGVTFQLHQPSHLVESPLPGCSCDPWVLGPHPCPTASGLPALGTLGVLPPEANPVPGSEQLPPSSGAFLVLSVARRSGETGAKAGGIALLVRRWRPWAASSCSAAAGHFPRQAFKAATVITSVLRRGTCAEGGHP